MKISSYRMSSHPIAKIVAAVLFSAALFTACKKNDPPPANGASQYSAEVINKWISLQLRLMRNTPGFTNQGFARPYVYAGVAAYEALAPGLNNSYRWSNSWNGLTGLPVADKHKNYYLPANVNAALAEVNRALFPTALAADKTAIDSLEQALNNLFLASKSSTVINESVQFGKSVAAAVIGWAGTDGASAANAPYVVPTGLGLWVATPPLFAAPATPYWGAIRPIIKGSTSGAQAPAPLAYSTNASSPYYVMVKSLYDASQTLTTDQKNMAIFWRDVPGQTSPGHWLSILQSTLQSTGSMLDKAAISYALTGAAINDALIACFASKYQYNTMRPITYIRDVMGYTTWNSHIGTPAHPEYPSAHSSLSAAAAGVMQKLFGNSGPITDHTYDYLSLPARSYSSFNAIAEEAGLSRYYAGIHFPHSIDAGLVQGYKVANNIFSTK
jgi:membrane-associated phospholipid phosphatase